MTKHTIRRNILAATALAAILAIGPATAGYENEFRALRVEERYDEAVALIEGHLEAEPADVEARTDLALTLLRMDQHDYARQQIDFLLDSASAEGRRRGEMLEGLVARLVRQEQDRERLSAALADLDATTARALIDTLDLSREQKAIVRMYVEIYSGDFQAARAALATLSPKRLAERKKVQALEEEIRSAEARHGELMAKVEAYWYSGDSVSTFGQAAAEAVPAIKEFSVQEYLETVGALTEHAPLSPRVMDVSFHAALLVVPDEADLLALARRILERKGSIRIPCFSRSQHFDLVIDGASRRLRTESVARPFVATHTAQGDRQPVNDWYLELVPFDVPFSGIGSIKQLAKHHYGVGGLNDGSYVLKLKSGGLVPNYALMPALHFASGEKGQRTATHNLGRIIVELADDAGASIKADLVDPEKTTTNKGSLFAAIVSGVAAGAGSIAAENGNFGSALQFQQAATLINTQLVTNMVRQERLSANQAAWHRQLTRRGFDLARELEFDEVETLLGLE